MEPTAPKSPQLVGCAQSVGAGGAHPNTTLSRARPGGGGKDGIVHPVNTWMKTRFEVADKPCAKATEFPKDVQVTRGWIVVKVAMTGRKSGLFQKSPRVVKAQRG